MSWVSTGPTPRYAHSAVLVEDRYMFVFFGLGGAKLFLEDVTVFDVVTQNWVPFIEQQSSESLRSCRLTSRMRACVCLRFVYSLACCCTLPMMCSSDAC